MELSFRYAVRVIIKCSIKHIYYEIKAYIYYYDDDYDYGDDYDDDYDDDEYYYY